MIEGIGGGGGSASDLAMLLCAGALVATSLVHSILGERRLIGPLLARREGVLAHDLARFLIRMVWHFMTLLFWILAAGLVAASVGTSEQFLVVFLSSIAFGIGGAGVFDAVGSRGRHIGWPMLVAIGVLAGLAVVQRF